MIDFDAILYALENPNSNGILSFVLGFLSMIMVYNTILYSQHNNKSYLFYSIYIGFIILSSLYYISSDFFDLFIEPIRALLFKFVAFFRWIYNLVYFLFVIHFVDLKVKSEKWYRIIIYPVYVLFVIGIAAQGYTLMIDDPKLMSNIFSRFFIPIIFIHSILGYMMLFKVDARFKGYLIFGSAFLLFSSMTGSAIYYLELLPKDNYIRDSIFYFGVVSENILFSTGLAPQQKYTFEEKNRIILAEKENQLKMVIETQERERARIAQELHDGVLQQMGGVLLQARNILTNSVKSEANEVQSLINNLLNSNDELRNISHQMMPKSLTELGLVEAIKDMLNLSLPYAQINHTFEHFNLENRLPQNIELLLFRVSQELVNNIVKHSQANHVNVQIFKSNQHVILIVEDNGIGISPKGKKDGIGLMNINSRVKSMSGSVNFESSQEGGTLVTVKIPLV